MVRTTHSISWMFQHIVKHGPKSFLVFVTIVILPVFGAHGGRSASYDLPSARPSMDLVAAGAEPRLRRVGRERRANGGGNRGPAAAGGNNI